MSKNKKRKKKPIQQNAGGFKPFLRDMQEALLFLNYKHNLQEMDIGYRRIMYSFNAKIRNPLAGNALITKGELKYFTEKVKKYYRDKSIKYEEKWISCYQLQLLYCFLRTKHMEIEKQANDDKNEDVVIFKKLSSEAFKAYFSEFFLLNFKLVTQWGNADQKYYGVDIRFAAIYEDNPSLDIVITLYGISIRNRLVKINGKNRPAFQIGKPLNKKIFEWIFVDVDLFRTFYTGTKTTLPVYIQSHALRRLKERLDLMDQKAINYALWKNTHDIQKFETYRGYLLLPINVFDIKIGYLAANVNDDILLFRTFLFITHNCTPEGDRLREMTGLGKHDISYWRIDRLSTFINMDENKYPGLIQLFRDAGLGDLMKLKDKEFDIDTMQAANLDGLAEYLERGKNSEKIREQEWDAFLNRPGQKQEILSE